MMHVVKCYAGGKQVTGVSCLRYCVAYQCGSTVKTGAKEQGLKWLPPPHFFVENIVFLLALTHFFAENVVF